SRCCARLGVLWLPAASSQQARQEPGGSLAKRPGAHAIPARNERHSCRPQLAAPHLRKPAAACDLAGHRIRGSFLPCPEALRNRRRWGVEASGGDRSVLGGETIAAVPDSSKMIHLRPDKGRRNSASTEKRPVVAPRSPLRWSPLCVTCRKTAG